MTDSKDLSFYSLGDGEAMENFDQMRRELTFFVGGYSDCCFDNRLR